MGCALPNPSPGALLATMTARCCASTADAPPLLSHSIIALPQVAAVVTQPGKPKGRGNKAIPTPSEVETAARAAGLPAERILCPASAKDVSLRAAPSQGLLLEPLAGSGEASAAAGGAVWSRHKRLHTCRG